MCPPSPSALVCNGHCTTSLCHRCMPNGNLWHSLCYTDAAKGPAHRKWVAGMEGGSNHCALLPGNTCQEAPRQNQVLSSVLANEVRRPLRLYGPVRPHSNPISIPNSYVTHELCVHASFYFMFTQLTGARPHPLGCYAIDRMGPKFVRAHNSLV